MLLLVTLLGAGLRLAAIDAIPPGLYQDEAYNGLDVLNVLGGTRPIYFTANNGREPIFIYLAAISVAALGRTPAAVRLPAAFVGILLIPATYALGRALFNRRVGLLGAAVCAVTLWPVVLSRLGLRAGALPLVAALSLACAAAGLRRGRPALLALGGALYGFTFYTYLAARFSPLALIIFLIFWYIARQSSEVSPPTPGGVWRARLEQLAVIALPALAVAAPLAVYAAAHPQMLFGRAEQVSIFSPAVNDGHPWQMLLNNLGAALASFVWRGDTIARHNLPGRPVFDLLMGMAWLVGVALCARRAFGRGRDLAAFFALAWTLVMLLPTALADDAPHFLREVGVLPMALLFPAVALEALARRLNSAALGGLAAAGLLAFSLGLTAWDYFGRYAASPDTAYLFQSAAADLAREANRATGLGWTGGLAVGSQREPGNQVYVDRRLWDNFPSLRFLSPTSQRLTVFAVEEPPEFAPGAAATIFVWPYEDPRPALGNIPAGMAVAPRAGPLARGDLEPAPYSLYSEYQVRPYAPPAVPAATFEGGLTLAEASAVIDPGRHILEVRLAWLADSVPGKDWQVLLHAITGAQIAGQGDGRLGTDLYPSRWWRAGEVVVERRIIPLPPAARPGELIVRIGIYDPETGARQARSDAPGDVYEIQPGEMPGT